MNKARINLWGSIFSIVGTVVPAIFLLSLLKPPSGMPNSLDLSGLPRLQAILLIGLVAAAAQSRKCRIHSEIRRIGNATKDGLLSDAHCHRRFSRDSPVGR
jgi:hypothetical protein